MTELAAAIADTASVPWPVRAVVGFAAAWLLARGAHTGRHTVRFGAVAAGGLAAHAVAVGPLAQTEPWVVGGAVCIGSGLFLWLERAGVTVTVVAIGAVAGAQWVLAVATLAGVTSALPAAAVGGLVAGMTLSRIYERWPRVTVPWTGAGALAWAAGAPASLAVVVVAWAGGVGAHLLQGAVVFDAHDERM